MRYNASRRRMQSLRGRKKRVVPCLQDVDGATWLHDIWDMYAHPTQVRSQSLTGSAGDPDYSLEQNMEDCIVETLQWTRQPVSIYRV
jgi:hypothetical protein